MSCGHVFIQCRGPGLFLCLVSAMLLFRRVVAAAVALSLRRRRVVAPPVLLWAATFLTWRHGNVTWLKAIA